MINYIILISLCIITMFILKIGFNIKFKDIKRIKELGSDKNLNAITDKFPDNKKICEQILKKLDNKKVKIEENNESKASLYIAITDKIIIANIKESFSRIQTIAHECLHSIQNRKILLFNFFFSNIYIISFLIFCILILFNVGKEYFNIYIQTYLIFTLIYIGIRLYLENEAMSKAEYVAKEYMISYMNENKNMQIDEIDKIVNGYKEINSIGIPFTNFYLISINLIKIIILCILAII